MILPADKEHLSQIRPGRILGIDFGEKRIGIAVSDPLQMTASTVETLVITDVHQAVAKILGHMRTAAVSAAIIGLPLHMSGEQSPMSRKAEAFAQLLAQADDETPVFLWDERWTTASAEKLLLENGKSPSRNRQRIDQIAAAFLLSSFLQRLDVIKRSETM